MSILPVIILLLIPSHGLCSTFSDVGLTTAEMIENNGYVCENHEIITQDGYILMYQRIPPGSSNNGPGKKQAVLLMHGMSSSSTQYVDMGPKHGMGYILAKLGYDVWLGNARGTTQSRRHKTLNLSADKEKFLDFSWHEIGYYDLPAAIDHILNVTKLHSLYYVGHSQGGTVFLVLASTRPEYAKKIKLASLLAPESFMENNDNMILKPLAERIYEFEKLTKNYRLYEIPFIKGIRKFAASICGMRMFLVVCKALLLFFEGGNQFTPEMKDRLPVLLSHHPEHVTFKQIFHYGQLLRNGGFCQYDYGVEKNREMYGQDTPPSYNLSKISIPVAVFYSEGDRVVNYKDVKMMIKLLPSVVYEYLGPTTLGHFDIFIVRKVIDPIHGKLIKAIENY